MWRSPSQACEGSEGEYKLTGHARSDIHRHDGSRRICDSSRKSCLHGSGAACDPQLGWVVSAAQLPAMSRFPAAWQLHQDPTVLGTAQGWTAFAASVTQGNDADMRALHAQIQAVQHGLDALRAAQAPVPGAGHGLSSKDLKPERFESNKKSDQPFKQWSEDVRA